MQCVAVVATPGQTADMRLASHGGVACYGRIHGLLRLHAVQQALQESALLLYLGTELVSGVPLLVLFLDGSVGVCRVTIVVQQLQYAFAQFLVTLAAYFVLLRVYRLGAPQLFHFAFQGAHLFCTFHLPCRLKFQTCTIGERCAAMCAETKTANGMTRWAYNASSWRTAFLTEFVCQRHWRAAERASVTLDICLAVFTEVCLRVYFKPAIGAACLL